MDFSVVVEYFPRLLSGAWVSLQLVVLSVVLGGILALPIALARISPVAWIRAFPFAYIFFFRGTPLLVQIFLVYYGASQFDVVRESIFWPILREPFWCAIIAFTLNTSAYTAEIFRGAIQAIPQGEVEACKVVGMTKVQMYRRILLPRAFGIVLPAYGNEIILMLKGSALASTITILDLTGMARTIIARTYTPMEIFLAAGGIYLLISIVVIAIFRQIELRQNRYLGTLSIKVPDKGQCEAVFENGFGSIKKRLKPLFYCDSDRTFGSENEVLNRFVSSFACTDSDNLLKSGNENFTVTNFSCVRAVLYYFDRAFNLIAFYGKF